MASQGASLQNYNNELVKCVCPSIIASFLAASRRAPLPRAFVRLAPARRRAFPLLWNLCLGCWQRFTVKEGWSACQPVGPAVSPVRVITQFYSRADRCAGFTAQVLDKGSAAGEHVTSV